jgi:hypothetical protein
MGRVTEYESAPDREFCFPLRFNCAKQAFDAAVDSFDGNCTSVTVAAEGGSGLVLRLKVDPAAVDWEFGHSDKLNVWNAVTWLTHEFELKRKLDGMR